MNELIFLFYAILSTFLGGIIGLQRKCSGKIVGIRTFALVCLGSCVFTYLSLHAFGDTNSDRVAANIVTGIGFLGAGSIIRREDSIEGLTTAAGFWIMAAIGMAVGSGYLIIAILATIITFILFLFNTKPIVKIFKPFFSNDEDKLEDKHLTI
jgi:putative Mg2+ transporter-C (MgtC) family protein